LWPQHRAQVDLLLTDVVMPGGISGHQLAKQLLADKPGLKIFFMSGYPGEAAEHGLELRKEVNFLLKPFSPDHLAQAIRDCLDEKNK